MILYNDLLKQELLMTGKILRLILSEIEAWANFTCDCIICLWLLLSS